MMKRKAVLFIGTLLLMNIFLTGCCLQHDWQEADCTTPVTCAKCGKSEGEALGHDWQEATCTEPKTCSVCGKTKGEALEHAWQEATCTEPRTCSVCEQTRGMALGHTWRKATCTTPKTCSVCGETEGEASGHGWMAATCTTPKTCKRCKATEGGALGHDLNAVDVCNRCGEYTGEGIAYTFEDGVLTVFGKGELTSATWREAQDKFGSVSSLDCHTLIITGNITDIGIKNGTINDPPFLRMSSYFTLEYMRAIDSLKKLIIEDSVTGDIGADAFSWRTNLTVVYIGDGIRYIESGAFGVTNPQQFTSFSVSGNCTLDGHIFGSYSMEYVNEHAIITYR